MAVLERYDKPFDRFMSHDHSKHLNVDVVSRDDMRQSTTVVHDKERNTHVISSDDKAGGRDGKVVFTTGRDSSSNTAAATVLTIMYWICALVGFIHPVFAFVAAFVLPTKRPSRGGRIAVFALSVIIWVAFVALAFMFNGTGPDFLVEWMAENGYEVV